MMVMSVSSVIVQESHYDPWGLELTGLGYQYGGIKANKYLYNGKELIEDNGLQYYDYGARMYDPVIGRWGVVDPLADQRSWVSPYNYVQNNPILRTDPTGALDDHYISNNGSIRTVQTDDSFDRFYVQNYASETGFRLAGQLDKNDAGLVQFPASGAGFSRYGSSDAGGNSTSPLETVGQGDHFLKPETAAALFGLVNKLNTEFGFNLSLGDMSSSNGSDPWQPSFQTATSSGHHAGHGHLGKRSGLDVDFRYLNTNGNSFQSANAFVSNSFSSVKNQTVYEAAATFGFTKNYQGKSGNLNGVTKVGGHNDHGHLGLQYGNLDWKYVQGAPSRQSNIGFNWLNK
jgi:RHS repeat-associated protein